MSQFIHEHLILIILGAIAIIALLVRRIWHYQSWCKSPYSMKEAEIQVNKNFSPEELSKKLHIEVTLWIRIGKWFREKRQTGPQQVLFVTLNHPIQSSAPADIIEKIIDLSKYRSATISEMLTFQWAFEEKMKGKEIITPVDMSNEEGQKIYPCLIDDKFRLMRADGLQETKNKVWLVVKDEQH